MSSNSYAYTYAPAKRYAIDLTLSENPLGCSLKVKKAIKRASEDIHKYPYEGHKLVHLLAKHHGIKEENIMLGAGANQLLEDVLKVYALGKNIVVPAASFPESVACVATLGGHVKKIPLNEDLTIDCAKLLSAVQEDTALIHVCNPNSPTGIWTNVDDLWQAANQSPVPLLISEAGIDFIGKSILGKGIHKNVIVVRSFSKAYGLAGLRIGYVVAHASMIARLKQNLGSYRASSLSIAAAIAALKDQDHLKKSITYILREKAWLMGQMQKLGFEVVNSEGQNFIARVPKSFKTAQDFCAKAAEYGIGVIDCSLYEGLEKHIRITPQKHIINQEYILTLNTLLENQDEK